MSESYVILPAYTVILIQIFIIKKYKNVVFVYSLYFYNRRVRDQNIALFTS